MVKKIALSHWKIEDIPIEDSNGNYYVLFFRVPVLFTGKNDPYLPSPSAFKDFGKGMSTDWSKYSTPKKTQRRGKKPNSYYGVVSLKVEAVKVIDGLSINHKPIQWALFEKGNRAHANIYGLPIYERVKHYKRNKKQVFLSRISKWEINQLL